MQIRISQSFIRLVLVMMLCTFFQLNNPGILAQDNSESIPADTTILLDRGISLVLDSSINPSDSVTIEIVDGIRTIIPSIADMLIQEDRRTGNSDSSKSIIDNTIIYLYLSKTHILPVWGVGGRVVNDDNGERIEFYYDPDHKNFKVEHIIRSMVHEFHHVCRIRWPEYKITLLECMVNEGLADRFIIEILDCDIKTPWNSALDSFSEAEIKELMQKIKPSAYDVFDDWTSEFDSDYFGKWMIGDDSVPDWLGYGLGWIIVSNYIEDYPDATAASLRCVSPEEIVKSTPELILN